MEALDLARRARRTVGLRGSGQSYGDASLNSGNICLDVSAMRRVLEWNPTDGIIRVEPGFTIGELWRHVIQDGWWPAVVPGTSFASIGGCTSTNIHGKNAWKVGPVGEHIEEFELLLPNGELRTCNRTSEPDLFHAAIGGFGMLGVLLSVTLRLKKVHSGVMDVEAISGGDFDEMLDVFEERMDTADYLVGWVDGFARGRSLGRGLIHEAHYLEPGADPEPAHSLQVRSQELPATIAGVFPKSQVWRVLAAFFHRPGMRAVNAVKYHSGRLQAHRPYRQPHAQFAFLLDFFPNWGRAYGASGMIQYQSFVPAEAARTVMKKQLSLAQSRNLEPFLGVLKRHRTDDFLITHGVDGYSLALEFKVSPGNRDALWALARDFDSLVIEGGGRFYLAKDATLSKDRFASFVQEPRIQRFLALKRTLDPDGLLETDLYRRVFGPHTA